MHERNSHLREIFIQKIKENGLKMIFVAEKAGIDYSNLSKWKNGRLDYGEDTLKKVINFLQKL